MLLHVGICNYSGDNYGSLSNMSAFEQWLDKAATRGPDRVIPSSVAIALTKDGISAFQLATQRSKLTF